MKFVHDRRDNEDLVLRFALPVLVKRLLDRLLPHRLRILWLLMLTYVAFNAAVRLGLGFFNGELSPLMPWRLVPAMAIGLAFDLGTACFFLAPLGLLLLAWPDARHRSLRIAMLALLLPLLGLMVFVGFAEFTFWNEFASRFNFIAVDYLIYTNEVIGNIRESYNLPLLLAGVGAVTLALWGMLVRVTRPWWQGGLATRRRIVTALILLILPPLAVFALDARYKEFSANAQANELAGNGYFDFWHAFWFNEIDYDRFYKTLPRQQAVRKLALELGGYKDAAIVQRPNEREITADGPRKPLNVVLVSIESFSAEFMGAFGNRQGLTPNLDRLAREGMLFTEMYATGTRTVRGLEALTLSVPPTPGHSIVKRAAQRQPVQPWARCSTRQGYDADVPLRRLRLLRQHERTSSAATAIRCIDRTELSPNGHPFRQHLGRGRRGPVHPGLAASSTAHAAGKPFFAHVMTTSNHRPYTYPGGPHRHPFARAGARARSNTPTGRSAISSSGRAAKPWFDDTVFVIVADHTHKGRGKARAAARELSHPAW